MRKATVLLILVLAFITVNTAQSQIRFGPKAGFTVSKMYIKTKNNPLYEVIPGFEIGGVADIPLDFVMENISFQPSLLFISKGYKYEIGDFRTRTRPMYIEIPMNVMYGIEMDQLKVYAGLGPYIGYGVAGKIKINTIDKAKNKVEVNNKINWGPGDADLYKPFDFGGNINLAFEYGNYLAGFNYSFGLTNISSKGFVPGNGDVAGTAAKLKNRCYNFTIGYWFGGE
jgi:hypothetical protein